MFLNFSYTITLKNEAQLNRLLEASLIEVKGDIRSSAKGYLMEARYDVGPEPIDLPKSMISDSLIPMH